MSLTDNHNRAFGMEAKRGLSSAGGGNSNWGSAEVQVFGMIFIASMCFG